MRWAGSIAGRGPRRSKRAEVQHGKSPEAQGKAGLLPRSGAAQNRTMETNKERKWRATWGRGTEPQDLETG